MIGDQYIVSPFRSYVRCPGGRRHILDLARSRLFAAALGFGFLFLCIGVRLVDVTLYQKEEKDGLGGDKETTVHRARASILDRNGEILATTVVTGSLCANAQLIQNPEAIARGLVPILGGGKEEILKKLSSGRRFVWLARHLTPKQQVLVIKLGIPGLDIIRDERRVYPHGPMTAHLVGMTDVDNQGISGVELTLDPLIRTQSQDIRLSIDIALQNLLYDELAKGMEEFRARSVNGIILSIETGEILAMASLPAFNPNIPKQVDYKNLFDRNVSASLELGSIMKLLNTALALEEAKVSLYKQYDATKPLKVGRFKITDYHGKNRFMNVYEIFQHSSNIGSGLMALDAGVTLQKAFFKRLGLLKPLHVELPGAARPLYPRHWNESNAITISYGYGISMTPLSFANAAASLLRGYALNPTLLYEGNKGKKESLKPGSLISLKTVGYLRALMRLAVTQGTARKANIPGYVILGKTGTAMQEIQGKYHEGILTTSFVGALGGSLSKPEYLVLVTYDRPKETEKTYGFRAAGWNACVTGGKVMKRMIPVIGLKPSLPQEEDINHSVNDLVKLAALEAPS